MRFSLILVLTFFTATLQCCSSNRSATPPAAESQTITITGTFKSIQGVMDPLSCYASNGGYVTQNNGERVAVMFKTEEEVTCSTIEVKGMYVTKTAATNPTSPCPDGQRSILQVESYTCK
ncbi:MAG: hypothetical protein IM638_11755 [Bacteroidetes bacterium]|nr:hypothetical protein [Bacteroidota bacterium]